MSDLPDPLTPPDCDLRGYEFMPLFGQRMFGSRFYSLALRNPRAGLAGMKLWWEAWTQCPAGSLPDDDFDLARMADFGTDMKGWKAVRDIALHGFMQCSDGRLYHPVLAKEAIDAWERRRKERARKAEQRAKRNVTGEVGPAPVPRDTTETGEGTDHGHDQGRAQSVRSDRTGQDRTGTGQRKEEGSELRSGASPPPDARTELWREGVATVQRLTGKPLEPSRRLVGKLLKSMGDDCAGLLAVLREAEQTRPIDPISWLQASVNARTSTKPGAMDLLRERWGMTEMKLQYHPDPDEKNSLVLQ